MRIRSLQPAAILTATALLALASGGAAVRLLGASTAKAVPQTVGQRSIESFARVGANIPTWSLDGRKILFESNRALDGKDAPGVKRTGNIWEMNADGSNQAPLTEMTVVGTDCENPVWSPDGRKILFTSRRSLDGSDVPNVGNEQNIWAMNADGSGQTPLTKTTTAGSENVAPSWSPDGRRIVFSVVKEGRSPDFGHYIEPLAHGRQWKECRSID